MTIKNSFSEVNLDVDPGGERLAGAIEPDTPFRILLLGDFSGRPSTGWRPVEIDRDNFDEVLERVAPQVGGLRFRDLDDFHPDQICQTAWFRALRAERQIPAPASPAPAATSVERPPVPDPASGRSLLDSMLEAAEPAESKVPRAAIRRGGLEGVVESIVAPYRAPAEDPDLPRKRASEDADSGELMRAILHQPAFQGVEAAWRAVFQLVRAVETSSELKVYLLDISKAELAAELNAEGDRRENRAWRLLAPEDRWSVVVGNYSFAKTAGDVELLGNLARIMSAAGAPFLAEADPGGDAEKVWDDFRGLPEARWIGLAMPRFLLRLPYGKKTSRVESFEFEEMRGAPVHQQYLWGNPAFACVQLLAEAFSRAGGEMQLRSNLEIDGLPVHVYEADGGMQAKPCAEVLLSESDLDWILEQGYMALASVRDRDAVRLVRFQSVAKPAGRLAGRWE